MKKVYLVLVLFIIVAVGFSQDKQTFTVEDYDEANIWSDTVTYIKLNPTGNYSGYEITFHRGLSPNSDHIIVQGKFDFSCDLTVVFPGKEGKDAKPADPCVYSYDR